MACKIMMSPISPRTLLIGGDLWNLEQLFISDLGENLTDLWLEWAEATELANEFFNSAAYVEVVCALIGFVLVCDGYFPWVYECLDDWYISR